MTEDQYRILCETCDSVLVADGSTLERIAIPWLHMMREHPVFLKQYEGLFESKPPLRRLFDHGHRMAVNLALWFRLAWRVVRSSGRMWYGELPNGAPVDVVFVSHLLALPQLSTEDDFYFGKVPADLARRGKSILLVLINHTTAIGDELEQALGKSPLPRVVISSGLPPKEEFRIWRRTANEAKSLRHAARAETPGLRKTVLRRASVEASANNTRTALRIARVLSEIASRSKAKSLITTYEGHAWERAVYGSVRQANSQITCVGYQHAVLFRLQHAAKRSLGKNFDPAMILAAGPVAFNQLQSANGLAGISLAILGSSRSADVVPRNGEATCLVLPEGIVDECRSLFVFSLLCAKACPRVKFIWRLHPIMSFKTLLRQIPMLRKLPRNIEISARSFEEDIACASWALYRGSTAIISAAASGVIPIYLEQPGKLSIDPLFEIAGQHPSVRNVEQFVDALGEEDRVSTTAEYCRNFYSPLDAEALPLP